MQLSVGRIPMGPNALRMSERVLAKAPEGAPAMDEAAQMVQAYITSLPTEQFSNLKELAEHFAITDQAARFDLLIDSFVDGIAARAASES